MSINANMKVLMVRRLPNDDRDIYIQCECGHRFWVVRPNELNTFAVNCLRCRRRGNLLISHEGVKAI